MTNFTRIAALATFATGIAFSAPDANASELGHIIIESADCKAADSGAFALGADSIDISTMCEQKGGAIVATWDNPGGDTAFEVWGMVAAADGSWTLDHQFTVYENKLVGDVSGPGLFSLFVRGLDTGYAADGGTALRYVDGTPSPASNEDAAGSPGKGGTDEVEDDDGAAGDDVNTTPASNEAELIQQLMDLIADLENEIAKLEEQLDDRDAEIERLQDDIEELKALFDKIR